MAKELTTKPKVNNTINFDAITSALMYGDLSKLNEQEKLSHYKNVCDSMGLNPVTVPFQYIPMNGKLVLYAGKNTAEQLRAIHKVSVNITSREKISDLFIVTAKASLPDGRCDESTGSVNVMGLKGEALANAFMKAETKAKRRVTLSICGLGMLDETEVETITASVSNLGYTPPVVPPQPKTEPPKDVTPPKKEKKETKPKAEGPPQCKVCNIDMIVSKNGNNWFCTNWQSCKTHPIKVKSKPKVEEQPMREMGDEPPPETDEDFLHFDDFK